MRSNKKNVTGVKAQVSTYDSSDLTHEEYDAKYRQCIVEQLHMLMRQLRSYKLDIIRTEHFEKLHDIRRAVVQRGIKRTT